MAILSKGTDFSTGDQVTAAKLDALVDSATFASGAVDNVSTALDGSSPQKIIVKDGGISTAKLVDSSVTKAKIEDVEDMKVLGNTSGSASAPQEVSVLDEDDMSSDSATSLATQQSIKAYVDGFRPKFVSLTGGTTDLLKQNQSNGTTVTYNIADFTSDDSDFGTGKIVGLVIEAFSGSNQNTNAITATLPSGQETMLVRIAANGSGDSCESHTTTTIPINSDTSSIAIDFTVSDTGYTIYNQSRIFGAIILPSL